MQQTSIHRTRDARRGVALIMVLGFLSILLILSVTFALTMRTERQAAAHFVSASELRGLVHAGLEESVHTLADPSSGFWESTEPKFVSDKGWAVSQATPGHVNGTGGYDQENMYIGGNTRDFIPYDLRGLAAQHAKTAGWRALKNEVSPAPKPTIGRVCWFAVDCSSYMDVHQVGAQERRAGFNVAEVDLDEWLGSGKRNSISNAVNTYVRFDALREIGHLTGSAIPEDQDTFFHYGRYPVGAYTNDGGNKIQYPMDIGGTAWALTEERDSTLQTRFESMGFTTAEAESLLWSLKDYIDGDSIPGGNLSPTGRYDVASIEPVPMINELQFNGRTTKIDVDPNDSSLFDYTFTIDLNAEFFYPHVTELDGEYYAQFDYKIKATVDGKSSERQFVQEWSPLFDKDSLSADGHFSASVSNGVANTVIVTGVGQDNATVGNVTFELSISNAVVYKVSGGSPNPASDDQVDRIVDPVVNHAWSTSAKMNAGVAKTYEVIDPRFNWDMNNAAHWKIDHPPGSGSSLGALNPEAKTKLGQNDTDGVNDQDTGMYCANDELLVPGELGYLPYAPWKTICLYPTTNRKAHPVDNFFRLAGAAEEGYFIRDDGSTNDVEYSKINLNTTNLNLLASVFWRMPIDRYPGDTDAGAFQIGDNSTTWNTCLDIAQEIFDAGPYDNAGNLAYNPAYVDVMNSHFDTELKRESMYRNSSKLFGTRNNVFTLIMLVQVGNDVNGDDFIGDDEVTASAKLAAVMWRDPFPDPAIDNRHEMFVRSMEYIYDD